MKQSTITDSGFNQTHKSLVRAILIAFFSLTACIALTATTEAKPNESDLIHNLPSFDVYADLPEITSPTPINVVPPLVGKSLKGTEVTMTFYISKSGYVSLAYDNADPYDNNEFELACLMYRALRKWKFEPAHDSSGNPISVKVKLPVVVVPKTAPAGSQKAALAVKRPVIIAVG